MISRIVLALVTALVWGCSATPRAAESSPGHTGHPTAQWRRVHGVISPEIDRLLTAGGITILSVWYDNAELLAVLDISMAHQVEEGWTILVGEGNDVLARIAIIEVDGLSAVGVVDLAQPDRPAPPATLQLS